MELQIPAVAALPDEVQDDVRLVVSELVSNAVIAAPDGTPIMVCVDAVADRLLIEVRNAVAQAPQLRVRPSMPPATHPGGRGLALVHRVSTDVFTAVSHGVLTVTAVVPTPSTR